MAGKHNAIISMGAGSLVVRLSENMGVRSIVSHLEKKNYLFKGKPVSKTAVHRFLTDHKNGDLPPGATDENTASGGSSTYKGDDEVMNIDEEIMHTFRSCRRAYDAQMRAVDASINNGDPIDGPAMRLLLATSKTLLEHLDRYIRRTEGVVSGQAIQAALNQQAHVITTIIHFTIEELKIDESTGKQLTAKLADNFARPPEEIFRTDAKP